MFFDMSFQKRKTAFF